MMMREYMDKKEEWEDYNVRSEKFVIKLNKLKILQCYQIQVIKILMGKTKTKYPVDITIQFVHPVIKESYNEKIVTLSMNTTPLTFAHI